MSIEAMKQALEASKDECKQYAIEQVQEILEQAISEAAKQEQGEPVAWIEHHKGGDNLNWEEVNHHYAKATPLYTTPQQRKPLNREQQVAVAAAWRDGNGTVSELISLVEAAHGIKE